MRWRLICGRSLLRYSVPVISAGGQLGTPDCQSERFGCIRQYLANRIVVLPCGSWDAHDSWLLTEQINFSRIDLHRPRQTAVFCQPLTMRHTDFFAPLLALASLKAVINCISYWLKTYGDNRVVGTRAYAGRTRAAHGDNQCILVQLLAFRGGFQSVRRTPRFGPWRESSVRRFRNRCGRPVKTEC